MTIWKFPIKTTDDQVVEMPARAKILCVQTQYDRPCLWALVIDGMASVEHRKIRIHGTGHPINDADHLAYIGTYQLSGGNLVFHVFEDTHA